MSSRCGSSYRGVNQHISGLKAVIVSKRDVHLESKDEVR